MFLLLYINIFLILFLFFYSIYRTMFNLHLTYRKWINKHHFHYKYYLLKLCASCTLQFNALLDAISSHFCLVLLFFCLKYSFIYYMLRKMKNFFLSQIYLQFRQFYKTLNFAFLLNMCVCLLFYVFILLWMYLLSFMPAK